MDNSLFSLSRAEIQERAQQMVGRKLSYGELECVVSQLQEAFDELRDAVDHAIVMAVDV